MVAAYDLWTRNREGLFWFQRFINLSNCHLLAYLDNCSFTYSPGTWGQHIVDVEQGNTLYSILWLSKLWLSVSSWRGTCQAGGSVATWLIAVALPRLLYHHTNTHPHSTISRQVNLVSWLTADWPLPDILCWLQAAESVTSSTIIVHSESQPFLSHAPAECH